MNANNTGSAEPMLAMFPPPYPAYRAGVRGMGLPPPQQAGSPPSPGGASPPLTENTVDKCPLTH